MTTADDLHAAAQRLAGELRAAGEVAAADRVHRVADGAVTTPSQWPGELRAALADARGLIAAHDWPRQVRAHRAVEAVAAQLPGARVRKALLVVAMAVAYLMALVAAWPAGVWLIGSIVPRTPGTALLPLVVPAATTLLIVRATWRQLPLAGRGVARDAAWLAAAAFLVVLYAIVV